LLLAFSGVPTYLFPDKEIIFYPVNLYGSDVNKGLSGSGVPPPGVIMPGFVYPTGKETVVGVSSVVISRINVSARVPGDE
jgi:hypothetical protein